MGVQSLEPSSPAGSAHAVSQGNERLRIETLGAARRFKNSWVEFGAILIQVRDRAAWRDWGFESFESYCAKELHIRQKTALKLTASYGFLMRHEPSLVGQPRHPLDADGASRVEEVGRNVDEGFDDGRSAHAKFPTFEAISVLAGAEARGQFGQEDYAALRERLWGEDSTNPKLARELNERFSEPRSTKPIDFMLRKFALTARKLAEGLRENTRIPKETKARAELLAHELDELIQGTAGHEEDGE